ncbi:MAG: hypothetical protein M3371_11440, partial [Acidobacteriota bacterium]|nr:hypothetical protein [Acidobacteriota bacterium]
PGAAAKSCQDCHMPGSYHSEKKGISVDQLNEKIAIIEDETYPEAENRVPVEQITVRKRNDFRRHEFLGLNAFLLEMFDQSWDVLGVSKYDYMSGSNSDLQDAIDNYVRQAQEKTAQVAISVRPAGRRRIVADVAVTNLAGHRFPSGVGFRRVFVELSVIDDESGDVVWASGRTNELGAIVDGEGNILPSEFFTEYTDPQGQVRQYYQPHYQSINAQDQVQIYEELIQNAEGKFTTSFIRRDETVKDNRLLAIGWTKNGPDPSLSGVYLKATQPDGEAVDDPDYQDGRAGTDRLTYLIRLPAGVNARRCTVRATLYYQSIPPYYLDDRFRDAPGGAATKRLYYLTSNLNLAGTPVENWKLKVATADAPVRRRVVRREAPRRTPQSQSPTGGAARAAQSRGPSRTRSG